jgi:hypothetical protein
MSSQPLATSPSAGVDAFTVVVGTGRGAARPGRLDPVSIAQAALSDDDLDVCATLARADQAVCSLLTAAKGDRELLGSVSDDWIRRLQDYRRAQVGTPGTAQHRDDPLFIRLSACEQARQERAEHALAARGGRILDMYSDDGNITLTRLLDSLRDLDEESARQTLRAGLRRIARTHSEVHDTAVREAIAEELAALGQRPELICEL